MVPKLYRPYLVRGFLVFGEDMFSCRPGAVPEGGAEGATAPLSGNLSLTVREKLTIRWGIFTDKHTYIAQTMRTCY